MIIDSKLYGLDITGITDMTTTFQKMLDSFPCGSDLRIPAGNYKIAGTVNIKTGIKIEAQSDVIFIGTGNNTLFTTNSNITFSGLGFQNCNTAISINGVNTVTVYWCNFKNTIAYTAIDVYNSSNISITNSFFYNILCSGVRVNGNSSTILILWNNFTNPSIFAGYSTAQISGHVYCLSGNNITIDHNTCNNNGGQGIILCYNSTTNQGVTNSIISNNHCEGNGQEGTTVYGGSNKVTRCNTIIGNTCINNRYNQLEVWQSDNNIIKNNIVKESLAGIGNLAAICLYDTGGSICIGNTVMSSNNNGISVIAGSTNCSVLNNIIADTNGKKDTGGNNQFGNGILLDWDGVADPSYIIIENNTISSSKGIINKSGIYSTSNKYHCNTINSNIISGYEYGVHLYAQDTCE